MRARQWSPLPTPRSGLGRCLQSGSQLADVYTERTAPKPGEERLRAGNDAQYIVA